VLALLVVVALLVWLGMANLRTDRTAGLTAVFEDSSPLTVGNQVRMNGALVGKIKSLSLVDGKSHVKMELDRSVLPALHADAEAKIEPVTLLGERFVALSPGTPSAPPLGADATIDVTHTSAAVDLDQLLNTLNDPTSTALAAMITTMGQGLQGNGDTMAKALQGLAPTFHEVDKVSRLLDQHNQVLDHFIVQVQRTLDQFSPPLDSLVDNANRTLGVVAANRQALNDTLVQAPSTLASARSTLAQLGDTATNTTDVLHGIRPTMDQLQDVSHELRDFSSAASPALDSLPGVLDRLNRMLDEARPVAKDLSPLANDLASASDSLYTIGHQVMKHPRGEASQLENLMSLAGEWGLAQRDYDGLSHIFRAQVSLAPNTLAQVGAGALPAIGKQAPFNPIQKDPRGQSGPSGTPGLPGLVPTVPNLDPETGPKTDDPPIYHGDNFQGNSGGSALTPKQEGNLFTGLFGGSR
jgi:phospholipid/cholesterol/gamma-HCH transport system substrate-binding protein